MSIEKFEIGKFYTYSGTKQKGWNKSGLMDFVLDGKPRKCLEASHPGFCKFEARSDETILSSESFSKIWVWGHLDDFYISHLFKQEELDV